MNKLQVIVTLILIARITFAADPQNITRIAQVQPPATSSLSDRLHSVFRTSDATPTKSPNCTTTTKNATMDFFSFERSSESEMDESEMDLFDEMPKTELLERCQSCKNHDVIIQENLESLKQKILHKLNFNAPPNMTKGQVPHIRRQIVEAFMKEYHIKPSNVNRELGLGMDREMQGDDPNADYSYPKEVYEEEEDDYFPITERLYVFPKSTRNVRHRHNKPDVLQFHFDNVKNSQISKAILHIFVHSAKWLKDHEPETQYGNKFNLTVHRIKRKEKSYHQMVGLYEGELTARKGEYVNVDITSMVDDWYKNPSSNYGIVIKVNGQSGRRLAVTDSEDKFNAPYIEISLEDSRKHRTKRSMSLNCRKDDDEKRCCRYPLEVDFTKFGWEWIIAPKQYTANYCAGECKISYLTKYTHTHMWQLSTSATPCCSPTKMSPLVLLYYDTNYNILRSTIPSMSVEKCSCS